MERRLAGCPQPLLSGGGSSKQCRVSSALAIGGGTQQLLLRKVQNCRPPPSHDTPRSAQIPHECAGSCPARALRLMGVPLRG